MKRKAKLKESILQGRKEEQATEMVFYEYMREAIRGTLWVLMKKEVEAHCRVLSA